jgi:hypothetical protein
VQSIANAGSNALYFERLDFDARGNITKSRLGNGVETVRAYEAASGHITAINSTKGLKDVQRPVNPSLNPCQSGVAGRRG